MFNPPRAILPRASSTPKPDPPMQTASITAPASTLPSANSTAAPRVPQKTLGQQDFLKLITVQLTKQDPMKPMEDTAFIAQMAQFTSLEQTNSLVKEFGLMRSSTDFSAASALLGREVSIANTDGSEVTGAVTSVEAGQHGPMLFINNAGYPLSSVFRVAPMSVPPARQPSAA